MQICHKSRFQILILDAMGVMYAEANDGPNLLYPFIVEKGGSRDVGELVRLWSAASLGKISSSELWTSAGLDPELEDEYLLRYRLSDGFEEFLEEIRARGTEMWCLSNDVSEWSRKLRKQFGLEKYFRGFVISGDVGARKPDAAIYRHLLERAGVEPHNALFADDRLRNVDAAEALGIRSILFNPAPDDSQGHNHPIVKTFRELLDFLDRGQTAEISAE